MESVKFRNKLHDKWRKCSGVFAGHAHSRVQVFRCGAADVSTSEIRRVEEEEGVGIITTACLRTVLAGSDTFDCGELAVWKGVFFTRRGRARAVGGTERLLDWTVALTLCYVLVVNTRKAEP